MITNQTASKICSLSRIIYLLRGLLVNPADYLVLQWEPQWFRSSRVCCEWKGDIIFVLGRWFVWVSDRSPVHNAVWHRDIWASPTCSSLAIRSEVAGRSHRCICSSFHCSVICTADLLYESWNKMFNLLASSLYYQLKALQILCELCSCHLLANFWLFSLVNNFMLQNQTLEDEFFKI